MCGIVGVLNLNGNAVYHGLIKKMTDEIAHRGYDGEGIFVKENIGLGHRRLAILDVSPKGAQPMSSKNDEWIIVFNGCIYNFHELKQELRSKGHDFVSTTDTEVIVEGLVEYGIKFIERLNGMFAIGAYNSFTKELYLCRDRFGVKPLYYWFNGSTIVFASEIKAIIKHPDYKTDLNMHALNEYFTFQNMFTYQTLFKDVFMLPPANTIKITTETTSIKHRSWWDYNFSEPDETMTFEDAKNET